MPKTRGVDNGGGGGGGEGDASPPPHKVGGMACTIIPPGFGEWYLLT